MLTDPGIWFADVRPVQKTTVSTAKKVAKVTVFGSGSAAIRVKAGSTVKRVVPVAVNPVSLVDLTQPAGRPWRNAKVSMAKPQQAKKLHQSE